MAVAQAYAEKLAAKPLRAVLQVKANVNAIARSGLSPVMVEPASLIDIDD